MPTRATKRGSERTSLSRDCDVLICGASFAGLAVARELAGSGADVLVVDRYEIGERQTSACGIPTSWLEAMGLMGSHRQTFGELVVHTPHGKSVMDLPWTFSTFDYRELCALLADQGEFEFETAKVNGRTGDVVHTDRGDLRAPLVVDALGWRRVLGSGYQPPDAPLSRGLEVHPGGAGEDLEIWIDRKYVPAGYGWCFPASEELRIGVGSLRPALPREGHHRDARRGPRVGGGPLPGQLDPAQAPRRHGGRRLLRRRLGRALPAPDRGGHPHGLLLRHRLRAGAAGGRARRAHARRGAAPLPRLQRVTRVEVQLDAAHAAHGAARAAAAAPRGCCAACSGSASWTGPSTTT